MKIGILQTGYPPESAQPFYGTYADAFARLLDGHGFEFASWACLDGEFPPDIYSADGWLVTGSKFGAYEDLPWIAPLEQFLRDSYAAEIPIVGICFGHQILAQTLGGKVEKYADGWSIGRVSYDVDIIDADPLPLYAWHQDQVTDLPPEAEVVGSTPFCQYAALSYGKKAFSVQPHPEFTHEYISHLISERWHDLPDGVAANAERSLTDGDICSNAMAEYIARFFKQSGRAVSTSDK
ncbi:hypothetical protein AB833_24620 [Chromatiales bacterium (ex Bugula neritina AB1)]|nr:hypothetical protein AB833_24620 [Chromatiales bacterium (ex Bugula neritina AB1)]